MYVEIPTVTRCCCCAPLRCGLLLWAYLKLAVSIVIFGMCLTWTVIFIAIAPGLIVYSTLLVFTLAIQVMDVAFNFVLIVGTHKVSLGGSKNTELLRLYYRYGVACGALILLLSLIWIFYEISTMSRAQSITSWKLLIIMSSLVTAVLFIHVYILILAHSNIVQIESHRQFRFVNHNLEPTCHLQETYEAGT